jgi:hypothetical protein
LLLLLLLLHGGWCTLFTQWCRSTCDATNAADIKAQHVDLKPNIAMPAQEDYKQPQPYCGQLQQNASGRTNDQA